MNELNIAILAFFSIFIYLSTIGFFWGIFKENCLALNNPLVGKSFIVDSVDRHLYPANPDLMSFLQEYWKALIIFGLTYSGIFGFFIEHVCFYQWDRFRTIPP